MELRCVNCGAGVRRLMVQYSPGNIRLMRCGSCKAVADPYVECEFMILLIDLILHKQKAYRHLLFNMLHQDTVNLEVLLWKAAQSAKPLVKCLITWEVNLRKFKGIVLAILLSSYFKIFLIAMMVWEFPSSVIFIVDIFVISSNAVALKVLTQLSIASCIGALLGAHAIKLFVSFWSRMLSSNY